MRSYDYEVLRRDLFTESGSEEFIRARDAMLELLRPTGAGRASLIFKASPAGDTWSMMAHLDRMVELGDVRYVPGTTDRAWQNQIVELNET